MVVQETTTKEAVGCPTPRDTALHLVVVVLCDETRLTHSLSQSLDTFVKSSFQSVGRVVLNFNTPFRREALFHSTRVPISRSVPKKQNPRFIGVVFLFRISS